MRLTACVCAGLALAAALVFAQGVSIPMLECDNLHIMTPDPAQARAWYIQHLGATAASVAGQAFIGNTKLVFLRNEKAQPSNGSTIDHLGLSVADVEVKINELTAGGAKVLPPAADLEGLFQSGVVQDPWGVKIEVLKDPDVLGLHHVHLRVRDPAATLTWFEQEIGGRRARLKGRIDGIRYGSVWLLAADSRGEPTAPSVDRAIQHIAWRVQNIDEARTVLIKRGIQVGDPRLSQDVRFAFLEDPSGVRVEVIQRPQP